METQYRQDKEYMEIVSDILESAVFQSTKILLCMGQQLVWSIALMFPI